MCVQQPHVSIKVCVLLCAGPCLHSVCVSVCVSEEKVMITTSSQ